MVGFRGRVVHTLMRRYVLGVFMDIEQEKTIRQFFDVVASLKSTRVIRSDKFLGDIAESICADLYNLELAISGRQVGYDGIDSDNLRVQIKYHGSITRTNINLGNPDNYDYCLVVLGIDSKIRSSEYHGNDFIIYKLEQPEIRSMNQLKSGSYSCGKTPFDRQPDQIYNLRT